MAPSRPKHASNMSKEPNENRKHRSRHTYTGRTSTGVPFEKRLKGLHKELDRSYLFYARFRNEFQNEIRGISGYADEQMLEELWFMKVRGRSALARRGSTEADADEEDLKPERDGMLFKAMKRRVFEALAAVWCSHVSDDTSQSTQTAERLDAIVSMHGKMRSAEKRIGWLLAEASDSSENCEQLLLGLNKFKELIDPKSEKNKVLYGDAWEGTEAVGGNARHATVVDAGD